MQQQRVQKLLSHAGYCSRRKAEEHIKNGDVTVNNETITIGDKATKNDTIKVNGETITFPEYKYYAFHKPRNVLTTLKTNTDKKTLQNYIDTDTRVYPCGRLDYDAEGLLILTNDGDFANKIMHPRYEKHKEYRVTTKKPQPHTTESFPRRITLGNDDIIIDDVEVHDEQNITVTIHQGQKHVVKNIFKSIGATVKTLLRTRIGPVTLRGLAPGQIRSLRENEIHALRKQD